MLNVKNLTKNFENEEVQFLQSKRKYFRRIVYDSSGNQELCKPEYFLKHKR